MNNPFHIAYNNDNNNEENKETTTNNENKEVVVRGKSKKRPYTTGRMKKKSPERMDSLRDNILSINKKDDMAVRFISSTITKYE